MTPNGLLTTVTSGILAFMAQFFACPYLGSDVELTDEREAHIASRHGDLLPAHLDLISQTLLAPDAIHASRSYSNRLLFSSWYDEFRGGKYILVVVAGDSTNALRRWIVTAHILRKPVPGEALWRRG